MKIGYVKEKRYVYGWAKANIAIKPVYKNVTIRKYGYVIEGNTMTIKFISINASLV